MSSQATKEKEQRQKSGGGIQGNMEPVKMDSSLSGWNDAQHATNRPPRPMTEPPKRELKPLIRTKKREDATKQVLMALVGNDLVNPQSTGTLKLIFKRLTIKQMYELYIAVSKCKCT